MTLNYAIGIERIKDDVPNSLLNSQTLYSSSNIATCLSHKLCQHI